MPKESRDQKRKKKLAERNQRARQVVTLAYQGDKYKTDEFAPLWYETETGIYQAFVIADRKLCDQTVFAALESLILKLRAGDWSAPAEINYRVGQEEALIRDMILSRWADSFAAAGNPPKDDLIGVLRSMLATIRLKKHPGPRSYGYLLYIESFLTRKAGVAVHKLPARTASDDSDEDNMVPAPHITLSENEESAPFAESRVAANR